MLRTEDVRREQVVIDVAADRHRDRLGNLERRRNELIIPHVVDVHSIAVLHLDLELPLLLPEVEPSAVVLDVLDVAQINKPSNGLHVVSRRPRAEARLNEAAQEIGATEK